MSKRTRAKRLSIPIPQSRDEANAMIRQIGDLDRQAKRIEVDMNELIAEVRERHEAAAQPLRQRQATLIDAVHAWAESNRADLTRDGKTKSAKLPAGEIQWRTTPPSVAVRGAESVLQRLRLALLGRFIRTKEEIDKEAILATPTDHPVRQIEGITINQREEFIVLPYETELSEVG
jgi:phage host-nuclease inhibitor protein Gam